MTEPVRTCVGCGRRAPRRELLRFTLQDGELAHDPSSRLAGRSAYTCRRLGCFERAVSRGAFGRTLRRPVRVPEGLMKLYEGV